MKLTRPAIAAVAVALLAAGSIPVVNHVAADDSPQLQPAVDMVETSMAEDSPAAQPPQSATPPEESEVVEKPVAEDVAKPEPQPEPAPPAEEVVGDSLPTNEEDLTTVREPADPPTASDPLVRPLDSAPKNTKGKEQRWYNITTAGVRVENGKVAKMPYGETLEVKSPSMDRWIPVALFRAHDENGNIVTDAPTMYLLNGAGGSEQDTDWVSLAFPEMVKTFKGQKVNVVVPMEGAFSYYVDWAAKPPVGENHIFYKGEQKWSTFLAHELPQAIEPYAQANDKRAVAGLSMAATSVLLLAEHNPGFYKAVGSFSGCAATSTPIPNFFVGLTVNRGDSKMTPEHVFGPMGSEYNRYNDALVMAEHLRGTDLYISTGTGLAAENDMPGYIAQRLQNLDQDMKSADAYLQGSASAYTLQLEGGAIEAAMNACTHDLRAKLRALDIPADFELRNVGTHSWPVWKEDLVFSWNRVIKKSLGL